MTPFEQEKIASGVFEVIDQRIGKQEDSRRASAVAYAESDAHEFRQNFLLATAILQELYTVREEIVRLFVSPVVVAMLDNPAPQPPSPVIHRSFRRSRLTHLRPRRPRALLTSRKVRARTKIVLI